MFRKDTPGWDLPVPTIRILRLFATFSLILAFTMGGPFGGITGPAPLSAAIGVWSKMDLNQIAVTAVATDPTNPNVIFVGTSGQGVYRSINAGQTWDQVNFGIGNLFINDILINPTDPTIVLAAAGRGPQVGETTAGIYRSINRGDSWSFRLTGSFVGDLDASSQNPQIIYAAGGPPVFRSINGGADWVQAFTDSAVFQNVDMRAVAVSPADSNIVLVGGATEGGTGSVFRTINSGQTWTRVQGPTIPAINAIVYSPTNSLQAFFANSLGVWRSRDAGATWNLTFGGVDALALLADRSNSNIIYTGTSGQGVLQTTNGGDTFQSFNAGLGNLTVRALDADRASPQTIWAGTGDGVWGFTLTTITQLPSLAISPASGVPGTVVSFTGTGFTPGGLVSVLLVRGLGVIVGSPFADQFGNVSGSFTMPNPSNRAELNFGPVEVFAIDEATGRETASTIFTLTRSALATTWYFAEGSTQPPFDTWYLVQNPTDTASRVRFTFFLVDGTTSVNEFVVAPRSRFSLFANQILPGRALSARIDADQEVFAERSMFVSFDGHAVTGIVSPGTTWLFAEGSTQDPFHTWLLLQNPNDSGATATITYLVQGGTPQTQVIGLPPASRTSIFVNQVLDDEAFSMQVRSDIPIIVERAMYRFPGNAATAVAGVNQPANTWFFAEGNSNARGLPTDTFLLLQNPNAFQVQATVTAFMEVGGPVAFTQNLPPLSRTTLHLSQTIQGSFGLRVDATAAIIAERSMFFGTEPKGASATVGSPTLSTTWHLAEGSTAPPFDEVIAIMNPNAQDAAITIEFQLQTGSTITRGFTARGQSKLSIEVDDIIPADAVSARITSSLPVVVERMMFIDKPGGIGVAGKIGIQ